MWNVPNTMSEDCLSLNIWTPHPQPMNSHVMVWIYGGGFYSGTSALPIYDGKTLASYTGAVIVTFNYRVGSLGFLSTGDGRITGNYGLKDQQLALRWIQRNIAKFGGNPGLVTLIGESAGGASIGYHMLSKGSVNLFKRAIIQSGAPNAHWAYMNRARAKKFSKKFFDHIGCPNNAYILTCLRNRSLSAETFIKHEWVEDMSLLFPWVPTTDGDFLKDSPLNLLRHGHLTNKELLLGSNKNEGTVYALYSVPSFFIQNDSPQSWKNLVRAINITQHDISDTSKSRLLDVYTFKKAIFNVFQNRDIACDVIGDRSFVCPVVEFAAYNTRNRSIRTYMYSLEHRATNEVWPSWMGVIHGAEIQYLFGLPLNKSLGYTNKEVSVSTSIMRYWSNFARYGKPARKHTVDLTYWPVYNSKKAHLVFAENATVTIKHDLRALYCNFWKLL